MRYFILILLSFVLLHSANAASNPSSCSRVSVECVKHQFDIGDTTTHAGTWAPEKGAALYLGDGLFQVMLYFSGEAISFYRNNQWAGIEIDLNANSGLPLIDSSSIKDPSGTNPLRDTVIKNPGDGTTRGITVINPANMKEGWNIYSFRLNSDLFGSIEISVGIQLVANVSHEQFISTLFEKNSSD